MGEIRNNKYNKSKCREIYKERKKCEGVRSCQRAGKDRGG